jgi:hypothetical protein
MLGSKWAPSPAHLRRWGPQTRLRASRPPRSRRAETQQWRPGSAAPAGAPRQQQTPARRLRVARGRVSGVWRPAMVTAQRRIGKPTTSTMPTNVPRRRRRRAASIGDDDGGRGSSRCSSRRSRQASEGQTQRPRQVLRDYNHPACDVLNSSGPSPPPVVSAAPHDTVPGPHARPLPLTRARNRVERAPPVAARAGDRHLSAAPAVAARQRRKVQAVQVRARRVVVCRRRARRGTGRAGREQPGLGQQRGAAQGLGAAQVPALGAFLAAAQAEQRGAAGLGPVVFGSKGRGLPAPLGRASWATAAANA